MSVICQCPSCKAKYQVSDQYAGCTVKCPKCSGAVVVPTVASPTSPVGLVSKNPSPEGATKADSPSISSTPELPKVRTVSLVEDSPAVAISSSDTTSGDQDADPAPPADDGLSFLADEMDGPRHRPATKLRAVPAVVEQASAEDESIDAVAGDAVSIPSLAARSPKTKGAPPSLFPHPSKKKKKDLPAWLIPTIAAVGAAAFLAIGAAIYLTFFMASKSKPGSVSTAGSSTASGSKDSGKPGKVEPKVPVLSIDWPENQRVGASLFVNDDKREIDLKGPILIPLPPSSTQYRFRLERRGFQPKKFARASQQDDQGYTVSEWEPVLQGIDWEQDFEAAKKTAATHNKNVLLLFDASDSKESSFASSRFAESVALRKEFRERAEKEYVCVYIDNPQKADSQGRVENADRNQEFTKKFRIEVFPTVVVTDPKGRPFGIMEDYKINGINAFLELMDKWDADGKSLLDLLARIDALPKESPNSDLVGKALDFLEMSKLDRFYGHTIKKLTARLPKGEGRPVTKEAYEYWMRTLDRATRNPDQAKKVVDEFDQWKKNRIFKNHDMGAALHLAAAFVLNQLGPDHRKEAAQKVKEGLAFEPRDPRTRGLLEQFNQALTGERGEMPRGSGTGFCIAEGNYVLTNHHVINGAKKINVHLNGEKEKYSAKLIADNEAGDMALLKIDLPAAKKLTPIPLMASDVKIGEDVCALGFPGVLSQNITLTLTKGIVSTLPGSPEDNDGFIATDCKVNPGNSGGPLCSFFGGIAGMVTAKSHNTSSEDSYGLVIPVARLHKFLTENLPADARRPPPNRAKTANLKLSDLAEKFAPSVVYIENLQ